jgi:predicted flap endonuclease-1-like 5' DNA nuclease
MQMPLTTAIIIVATEDNRTLVGINQDGFQQHAELTLVPAAGSDSGYVLFGFDGEAPLSGVNEHKLVVGIIETPDCEVTYPSDRPILQGNPVQSLLESCSTVDEALDLIGQNNILIFDNNHLMIVDSSGAAAIVGADQDTRVAALHSEGIHRVLSNFSPFEPARGGAPCYRAETSEALLEDEKSVSLNYMRNILSRVHSEAPMPTLYSLIHDLDKGVVHLFHYHDFGEAVHFNVQDALKAEGRRAQLAITDLFPVKYRYFAEMQAIEGNDLYRNYQHNYERRLKMTRINKIEGIGPSYAAKLTDAGVDTAEVLLEKGATAEGRKELAEKTGITGKLILEWVNLADLFRIKGVGEEYADLLEEAGVDTVPELAQRNAENLYNKMVEVNNEKKLVRKTPGQAQVADWVAQAKALPRVVNY